MTEYIGWLTSNRSIVLDESQEIVRCRDCVHFHPMEGTALSCRLPHPQYEHLVQWQFAEPDGYCWRGKRKECGE